MSMDTEASLKEYLSLQLKLPCCGAHRPAGPHLRLRGQRRARGEGDPDRRQGLLRGARGSLRPGRGGRLGLGPHRRPARRAAGHQGPGAGGPGARPDRVDARHPVRPGPHRRGDRGDARGDAGQRDARARGAAARRDDGRPGRGGREPGAARAVHPRRGGGVQRAARARAAAAPGPSGRRRGRAGARRRRAGGQAATQLAEHLGRTARRAAGGRRAAVRARAVPAHHGVRATGQIAEALGAELGTVVARPAPWRCPGPRSSAARGQARS